VIPPVWVAVWLVLGAYRLTRLAGWDDFPLALRVRAWLTGANRNGRGVELYDNGVSYERPNVRKFLFCPFCVGFWISLAVYICWLEEPRWTLYGLAPFALSAGVGLVSKNLDP
jgi:hypothetical protein